MKKIVGQLSDNALLINRSQVRSPTPVGIHWGLCMIAVSSCVICALLLGAMLVPVSIRHQIVQN